MSKSYLILPFSGKNSYFFLLFSGNIPTFSYFLMKIPTFSYFFDLSYYLTPWIYDHSKYTRLWDLLNRVQAIRSINTGFVLDFSRNIWKTGKVDIFL